MNVSLNLANSPGPRDRYGFAWAVPVVLLGLGGLVLLSVSANRGFRQYRQVRRERLELQDREAALNRTEKDLRNDLEHPKFRGLYRETQFVNTLIDKKRLSLVELTERVTQLLPASVHLISLALSHSEEERVVRFIVAGSSEEAIENFLIHLEDSPDFKDVGNLNWGLEAGTAAAGQVSVAFTARYLGSH